MPTPATAAEFLAVVEKSGLLQGEDLVGYRNRSAVDTAPPDQVANWMVTDGRLTPFQVGLLLAGKTRPFFVGKYKVLSRIGNGSMGVVYLCEHRRARDEVALERFLTEVDPVQSFVPETGEDEVDLDLAETPLAFDTSPPRRPRKISRVATSTKPWWRDRRWQLLILGLAGVAGFVAALVGGPR